MFKNFNKLFTKEWFILVRPVGLIGQIIKFIKLLLPFNRKNHSSIIAFKNRVIKAGYTIIEIDSRSINYIENSPIAGKGIIANSYDIPTNTYHYQCKLVGVWDILGCGYTKSVAVRGFDYIINDGVYWFKKHPSEYCYTTEMDGIPLYHTVAFSGADEQCLVSLSPVSASFSNEDDAAVYDNMIRSQFCGLDNNLHLLLRGIKASKGIAGKIVDYWEQGDKYFIILASGSFVEAHKDSIAKPVIDNTISLNDNIHVFTVKLNDKVYPVSVDLNDCNSYPDLLTQYPNLRIVDQHYFYGSDLLSILNSRGYHFTELTNSTTAGLLPYRASIGNVYTYLGTVTAKLSSSYVYTVTIADTVTFPDTLFKNININVKHI